MILILSLLSHRRPPHSYPPRCGQDIRGRLNPRFLLRIMSWLSRFVALVRSSSAGAVNIASPEFKSNPHGFYARLRSDSPIHRIPALKGEPAWLITRYDDVVAVLKDHRFVKMRSNVVAPRQSGIDRWLRKLRVYKSLEKNMLDLDPPDHTRLRLLVNKAFTPGLVEQLRPRI